MKKNFPASELIINSDGSCFHLHLRPEQLADRVVLVLDPMLATGGSAAAAITFLKKRGAKNVKMLNIVGSPEGVSKIEETHPDVDVYLGSLDEKLNDHGYIVPGLGVAGDRLFGTL